MFSITQSPATSLATIGTSLYAAHGDATIDVFDISIPSPQRISTIAAQANITALHANNGKLFASSAVATYVFVGSTQAGSVPFSIVSLAPISGDAVFAGSNDRALRGMQPGRDLRVITSEPQSLQEFQAMVKYVVSYELVSQEVVGNEYVHVLRRRR